MVVFGDQVTKILHNSLFSFFTEQGKTGKNGTHENLATYFWYFGSFDKKRKTNLRKYVMSRAFISEGLINYFLRLNTVLKLA